jgi:two-component system cell cycle sensor histidine kinase/response regulator CckA
MTESLRLFVIENDDDTALLIRRHLERAGHAVTRCRTAADALIVLGHAAFDLVLLGRRLDDGEGLDLLSTLAREGISVPVIVVTGKGDEQLAARVLRAGALDYIVMDSALTFLAELPERIRESVTRHRLEQMNRLLIQALESARDGILITDLQGTILKVNQALVDLTGYSRQELLGQTPRLLKSPLHPPGLYARMWQTILARRSWQGELTNRRKDGTLFQASLTVSPIVDAQGRLTHFVGIQRDVSEHKQLERALLQAQKMQSVGTLAGGVAHEFNNLLAGINGYAALGLREPNVGPVLREFLERVVDLSERAAGLTRQLLAFARKPALARQPTAMPELVRNTAGLVTRTLRQEVRVDLSADERELPRLTVEADANQLQQALVNLALNARDAVRARQTDGERVGADGAVVFRLRSAVLAAEQPGFPQQVPPGDYVVVEVEDGGTGMTPDVLNQSLDPFFTTKEVGQGTGLGLPMVFGIVQGHQGYLTIDSELHRGTRVCLYLPRAIPGTDTASSSHPGDAAVVVPESTVGRSILVIDDEVAVLDVVRRFLQIAGHSVTCASSGQEGLEHLAAGRPCDLIVLDLMMPREDALMTFQLLRQRRPGVPVLLCTGLPQVEAAPELLSSGAAGLIRKPFRMNELWSAVEQALRAK